MATRTLNPSRTITASCNKLGKYEKPVQSGLSLTPRDVKELTDRGIAVSTPNSSYTEASPIHRSDSWFVEPQDRRGMDMNTAWEISQRTRAKIIAAHKSDKRKFG